MHHWKMNAVRSVDWIIYRAKEGEIPILPVQRSRIATIRHEVASSIAFDGAV